MAKMTLNQAMQKATAAYTDGNLEVAKRLLARIIQIEPNNADANHNMGHVLAESGNLAEAIPYFKTALEANYSVSQHWFSFSNALFKIGKYDEAAELLAIARTKGCHGKAFDELEIKLNSEEIELRRRIERLQEADFDETLSHVKFFGIGDAWQKLGKLEEAIEAYNKALAIKPDYAEAYSNMGIALKGQGKLEEAIKTYNKALAIKPDYEIARGQKLHQQAHICDWNSITADLTLIPELGTTNKHVLPFGLLSLEDAPERHRTRAETYTAATYQQRPLSGQAKVSQKPKRIRLGYFSTDFKEHPVAYLIAKMLEQHDRDQFEVFGYSLHGNQQTDMRQRLAKSFDRFVDVRGITDGAVALQARQDGIDIAIDLNGYTEHNRAGIFASRAAPIQINYLGYPGTLGARFIDYIVADPILIPVNKRQYYSEKIIYLPNTYQPTDNGRVISNKTMKRENMGLPNQGFVFCCFNNNYKISPAEFDIWMRLLNNVEGSVLWLLKSNELATQNLKRQAESRGISADRVIFAERLPQTEHLARQRLADLFLDTFNYNAHTTTSDALWAGLPVVTKMGQGFAARVAGSLLAAVGLPELITLNEEDYEALILELATNPTKLAKIKEKLVINRLTQPLFNTELYTRHLENGYQQAYQNFLDGNSPQTITVPG